MKVINYTEEQVSEMTAVYKESPRAETVQNLAITYGKTTRSIIAKLSREGVYVAKQRVTKTGDAVISKAELVKSIEIALDIDAATLVKAGKQDLQILSDTIASLVSEK